MPEQISSKYPRDYGKILFEWAVSEFPQHKRSGIWYLVMLVLAVFFIIYSIITQNFLFALIIILIVFIIFLRSYAVPAKLRFKITEDGIIIGNQFFPYKEIDSFYFIYDPPAVKKVYFSLKGFAPDLSIPLDDMNPLAIREKLLGYLIEDLEREYQSWEDQLETILKL